MERLYVSNILQFADKIKDEDQKDYTDAFLKLPHIWIKKMIKDKFAVNVDKCNKNYNYLICASFIFKFYIESMIENYVLSNRYNTAVMHDRAELKKYAEAAKLPEINSFDEYFVVMVYGYICNDEMFVNNEKLKDSYEYISDWMTQECFNIYSCDIPSYLFIGSSVTKDDIEICTSLYDDLPDKLKKALKEERWRLILTNAFTENLYRAYACNGCLNSTRREILLKCGDNFKETFYHQIGLFNYQKYVSAVTVKSIFDNKMEGLKKVYSAEQVQWTNVFPHNCYSFVKSYEEFFAQSIVYYYTDYYNLKSLPKTFEAVEDIIRFYAK